MNILFVCTGNTCRSPMAEGYLDSLRLPNVKTESRGLAAEGGSLSQNTLTVMEEKGIDLRDNVSVQLTSQELLWADKIIYMSKSHLAFLRLYAPEEKLFMLSEGISDPYGGDIEVYRQTRNEIFAAVDSLVKNGFFDELIISKASQNQIKAIFELEKECFSSPWSENSIKSAMDNNTLFFVACIGDSVVGYVGISTVLDEGYITNVAVGKDYRKRGIATALINRVFAEACDRRLTFVSLEVRVSNQAAISLYANLGFKEEGCRRGFYDNPKEDALILTKRF